MRCFTTRAGIFGNSSTNDSYGDRIRVRYDALLSLSLYLPTKSASYSHFAPEGCIITYLSKLLEDIGIWSIGFATDINPHANLCTLRTAKQNNIQNLEVIQCNFAAPVKEKLQGKIDVLVFNPPYVPTPNDEVGRNDIAASWAGGDDGRVVIDRFLPNIPFLLSKSGVCYMVLVQENKPEELCRIIQDKYRLSMSIVKRYKARNEQLMIVKIVHMASNEFGSMIV